jgi:hypothetical protein
MATGCQMVYLQTKNPNFGIFLVGLGMENFGKSYNHFGIYKSIWCSIVPPFGKFCGNLVYIFPLWHVRK